MLVSVIIASYNSSKTITACLEALRQQATSYPYEIVVADSSDDHTAKIIGEKFPEVKLIRLPARTYPGPARNAAVQGSKGEILAFLDTDCTVPSDWLACIGRAHQSGHQIVGGAVLNGTRHSYVGTAEHIIEFSEYSEWQKARSLRMIPTCNLSIRREIFDKAGRFESVDTGKMLFKSEDLLLCHRIRKHGYSIYYNPRIKVYHHNRTSLRRFLKNQLALGFSSAVVRRLVATKGSAFVQYFPLAVFIPAIKTGILLKRLASYRMIDLFSLVFHIPMIFVGSCFYTIGFFRGIKFPLDGCRP
ncbi:MAG: glycosyltransferase [Desulfobacterales bacterium]|nr:MAG: glycosyltransferase [Desulfobacterales bacterium]